MGKFMTVREVAEHLRVDEETVRRYLRDHILRGTKLRHEWRITDEELDRYIKEQSEPKKKPEDEETQG